MTEKPTYEEQEQRIKALENDLEEYRSQNGAVQLSEQYLKVILDNTNLPIYLKDADYKYLFVNSEYERLAHVTNDQIAGKDDFAVFPVPIAELFRSQDEEVKQRRTLLEFSETIELDDGEHTFITAKFPLTDAEGHIYAIGGVCTNITSLQKTQDALQESEERYRSFIETFHGIAYRGNIRIFTPIYFHGAVENITGYTEKEFLAGKPSWDQIVHPEDLPIVHEEGKKMQDKPCYSFRREYRIFRKDGELIWVFDTGRNICNEHDKPTWVEGTIYDITGRKNTENALKENEKKFRSVIESCPEGIHLYTLEPDGRLVFTGANPAANTILGVDHRQFIGLTVEEAFPSSVGTELPEQYREVCRNGVSLKAEQLNYEDNQIKGAFEVHTFQTQPGQMAAFFTDVTKKYKMEEELQKIQKLESVGILAGGIAHDFNNLLTAILGNISMAKIFSQTDMNKVLERLTDAENASLRARDLTQQLLTFSKGGTPVKSANSITDVVKDSSSFMLSGSNVKCDFKPDDQLWPVNIDAGQISQVIQNIVKNADQAMPDGGTVIMRAKNKTVSANDHLPLRDGRYIHISITDQGVGILQKHLSKVFDPYFSTKQEGSGLGLAASFSIIKNHDGLLCAESKHGVGASFHIYLPASEAEPSKKIPSQKNLLRSGENILIMDDDLNVLNVAEKMLNLMGYKTATAEDGTEAVTLYRKAMEGNKAFDAVILDLTIPGGMGGKETLKQLAALDPDVKAIVSSGYANDPIMSDFENHGFQGVVAKPYDMEKLGESIRKLFG